MDGAVDPGSPPAFTYQSNPYFTGLLGGSSCADGTSTAVCYARIYIPWDAVNDGKGSASAGTCQRSPTGSGTMAAVFVDEVTAAARAVGVGHVLVALASSLSTSKDDIWPTDSEYECGLRGLEEAAPGVTQWEIFNEPDSAYIPDSVPGGGPNCVHRNGIWVASQDQCVFGQFRGHPVGWQRTRRQCPGGGVLVPRCQASGSEQESHAGCRRLQLQHVKLSRRGVLLPQWIFPGAVRGLSGRTGRDRAASLPRCRLRGAQRRRSAASGDFRPPERAGRDRRHRPGISHRSTDLGDRGRGVADELGEGGGDECLR